MDSFNDVFQEVLKYCRNCKSISEPGYNKWIKILEPMKLENNVAYLLTDSDFSRDITMNAYENLLKEAFLNTLGFEVDIKILVKDKEEVNETEEKDIEVKVADFSDEENNNLTFDNFIKGKSNDLAYAFSTAVAHKYDEDQKTPSNTNTIFNPLIIYGDSGLGKTHLMHSIARYILENHPEYSVMYTTSENFMNNVVDAIRTNRKTQDTAATSNLRKNYRNVDVLLIDDIQFIIGKDSTQIEFFNTFEALYQSGKQLVISSDKPPSQMEHLDMRYRSRFTSGMTIDIQPPDYEMSMAILRNKQENSDIQLNEEILDYIATNIKSNIRILEGAYNKILLFARFTKPKDNKIDLNMAKEALKDFISPNENMVITADYIIDIVADHFNLDKEAILSEKRTKTVSIPRQICMYLCNELTNLTLTEIAVKLKRSNHSTVIHGVHKIEQDILVDKELEETINVLKKKLNS